MVLINCAFETVKWKEKCQYWQLKYFFCFVKALIKG